MEIGYEGQITPNNFWFFYLKLKGKLLFYKGRRALNLYWSGEECGPLAEICSSKINNSCKNTLSNLCLNEGFIVKDMS